MKKPKSKKYPTRPKETASIEVHEKWAQRCKDIKKDNDDKMKPYNAYLKKKEADKKKKGTLKTQVEKLKK